MTRESVSKLYVGNLPLSTTEQMLKDLLSKYGAGLSDSAVVLKKGYAFVELSDQNIADIVIDNIHGIHFNGNVLVVEPAFRGPRSDKALPRITISQCDEDTTSEEVEQLLSQWGGTVTCVEKTGPGTFTVTLSEDQSAQELIDDCKGTTIHDMQVKMEVAEQDIPCNGGRFRVPRTRFSNTRSVFQPTEFPLRMLIPAEWIGAVIGRGGSTIKSITHATGARVDVFRSNGSRQAEVEKVVTILGSADSCSAACKKILELLAKEASSGENPTPAPRDIVLKMLCTNNLVGRVIGKSGINIKRMMETTQTKIHVSNQSEYTRRFLTHGVGNAERIITIRGSIDGMCKAEVLISAKMKAAFDMDNQKMTGFGMAGPSAGFYPNYPNNVPIAGGSGRGESQFVMNAETLTQTLFHSLSLRDQGRIGGDGRSRYGTYDNNNMTPMGGGYDEQGSQQHILPTPFTPDRTYLYIPSNYVGAIIGNRGTTIRAMIRESGASLKIESGDDAPPDVISERRVTIFGQPENHWSAQYLIFQKLTEDGRLPPDLQLTLEMAVPSDIIGRLIGRGGSRIREIQEFSKAQIKFLTDEAVGDETFAQMFGDFESLYAAQRRLRHAINLIRMQIPSASGHGQTTIYRNRSRERGGFQTGQDEVNNAA